MAQLFTIFYDYLEKKAPQFRHVFRASMHVQSKVLVHISSGMRALLMTDNFTDKVVELTKTHLRFGVQLEYFDALGVALIYALKEVSGHYWTKEVDTAWRRLYAHCAVLLLEVHKQLTEPDSTSTLKIVNGDRARRLPKECLPLVGKYLPSFNYQFASSDEHRQTRPITGTAPSGRRESEQEPGSSVGHLYDVFYEHIDKNAPELKEVFRSSIHVRSKVMLHISVGMRSLLQSTNVAERVSQLTTTHFRYGVKLEHFDALGLALIHAMKACSGRNWSVEIENAWCRLYGHCGALLLVEHSKRMRSKKVNVRGTESRPTTTTTLTDQTDQTDDDQLDGVFP